MKWPLMGETITFADRLKMAKFILTTKKFTNGEKVKKFEREWNDWLGSKHSLYVSSGSTANFLLLASLIELFKLKPKDKVLVPACTWMTNVAPIMQLGLTPIFCDINLQNYSFDLEDAKFVAQQHPDIKAIFVTHLLGFPAENKSLQEIFPNAVIIDDVCESHGACFNDDYTKVGSNSLGATFSFYFGHHMSTIEGGMVSTNNEALYDIMRMKRSHGMARESKYFEEHAAQWVNIDKSFLFITDGYNFRNHEVCAVLGSSQLKRLDKMISIRRRNYKKYVEIINQNPDLFVPHSYEYGNSSFCFPFVCNASHQKIKLVGEFKKNGIEYRPIVSGNLLEQPFLQRLKYINNTKKRVSNAMKLQTCGVYIGNNHFVTENDMNMLSDIIRKVK